MCGIVQFQEASLAVDFSSLYRGVGENHLTAALCLTNVTRPRTSTLEKSSAAPKWP